MYKLLLSLAAVASVIACPQHDIDAHPSKLNKRADASQDWAYEASYNWGMINSSKLKYPIFRWIIVVNIAIPDYSLCQTGTTQSPIQLLLTQGNSQKHIPTFNYSNPILGNLYNVRSLS